MQESGQDCIKGFTHLWTSPTRDNLRGTLCKPTSNDANCNRSLTPYLTVCSHTLSLQKNSQPCRLKIATSQQRDVILVSRELDRKCWLDATYHPLDCRSGPIQGDWSIISSWLKGFYCWSHHVGYPELLLRQELSNWLQHGSYTHEICHSLSSIKTSFHLSHSVNGHADTSVSYSWITCTDT